MFSIWPLVWLFFLRALLAKKIAPPVEPLPATALAVPELTAGLVPGGPELEGGGRLVVAHVTQQLCHLLDVIFSFLFRQLFSVLASRNIAS